MAEHPAYRNSTLVQNAAAASRLIISTSSYISNMMTTGADSFTKNVKPNAQPATFAPSTHDRVRKIHSFTAGAAGLSAKTVGQATKFAQNIGASLARKGEKAPQKEGFKPGLLNKSMIAFSTIADGIAYSGKNILNSSASATSTMVGHKWGPEAGTVAASLAGGVKNVAVVYIDVTGVSRKAVIKSVAKGMVVGRSKDHTVIVGGGDGGDLPPEALQHTRPGATPGPSRQDSYGQSSVRSGASTPAPSVVGYGNATAQGYNRGVGENIGGSSLQGKEFKDYKDKY